jgi:hypothetical protein
LERLQRACVFGEAFALQARRRVEIHAEPGEIRDDRRFKFGFAALRVDVIDAQEKASAGASREIVVAQGRVGMAKMQPAIGRGREADGRRRAHAVPPDSERTRS